MNIPENFPPCFRVCHCCECRLLGTALWKCNASRLVCASQFSVHLCSRTRWNFKVSQRAGVISHICSAPLQKAEPLAVSLRAFPSFRGLVEGEPVNVMQCKSQRKSEESVSLIHTAAQAYC